MRRCYSVAVALCLLALVGCRAGPEAAAPLTPAEALAALAEGDDFARLAAIETLGRDRPAGAVAALAGALADPAPAVRAAAVEALASFDGADATAALRARLPDERHPAVLARLAAALGARRDADSLPALRALAAHADDAVTAAALGALARAGTDDDRAALEAALDDRRALVRVAAVEALAARDDEAALPALAAAFETEARRRFEAMDLLLLNRLSRVLFRFQLRRDRAALEEAALAALMTERAAGPRAIDRTVALLYHAGKAEAAAARTAEPEPGDGAGAAAALTAALDDPHPHLRLLAVGAVPAAGATEALPRLEALFDEFHVTALSPRDNHLIAWKLLAESYRGLAAPVRHERFLAARLDRAPPLETVLLVLELPDSYRARARAPLLELLDDRSADTRAEAGRLLMAGFRGDRAAHAAVGDAAARETDPAARARLAQVLAAWARGSREE